MSFSSLPRRSANMLQSSAIPYGAHQFATGQVPRRKPTIGAPDVIVASQPNASLKRRSHIRRTSRSGTSPTESSLTVPRDSVVAEPSTFWPAPLVTAFTRTITASSATLTPITRRPTLMEPATVEWRDAPRYQPDISSKAELSRRSTIASVYSIPSTGTHYESRRSTQENYVVDWSFVDQALQNRAYAPRSSSHVSQDFGAYLPMSPNTPDASRSSSYSVGSQAGLYRTSTAHVQSLLQERRRKHDIVPESPLE
ncbi:hypothetical protein FRC12_016655 [Ceratobasidium sp. 428]|nr:hypothetical protein FRC12_016655 [Ceratobasidium sp. 428]